ncbi:capsid cement protein [Corynebacterium mastitidis]|uniref:DUF2190 domain-containing protein n=1 Tax=Corynebacterium mastitidis TaxID=161890 RepID=A0A2N0X9K0_9CORY|nr:capsid cement protein [Corynebacterium mastitidis]PKF69347.1 DUF2190 domain-containing protein [Corynebacterium mastitidis]
MFSNPARDYYQPGTDLTARATTTITGKTFVSISGPRTGGSIQVTTCNGTTPIIGVAKYDTNQGGLVGVARGAARILTITAGEAITAGQAVTSNQDGQVIPATEGQQIAGWAIDNATPGEDALISLAH